MHTCTHAYTHTYIVTDTRTHKQTYIYIYLRHVGRVGVKKNKLTVWSLLVVGGDRRVQSSWAGDLLPVSFCSLLFSVLFFVPYERISCSGWGWRFLPLFLDPFLLLRSSPLSFLLLSFLLFLVSSSHTQKLLCGDTIAPSQLVLTLDGR